MACTWELMAELRLRQTKVYHRVDRAGYPGEGGGKIRRGERRGIGT